MGPPEFLFDGPARAGVTLALAHGAGAAMDSPFMSSIAAGLAGRGLRVARFEFPYMARRRSSGSRGAPDRQDKLEVSWIEAVEALGGGDRVIVGGKSLGGRIASMIADRAGARGLICLGYPFHPPGRPEKLRTAHLARLTTPALILQGTRDPFGKPEEVAGYTLSPKIRVTWIEDGDHSLKPRKSSGRTAEQNLEQAIEAAADFAATVSRA